MGLHCLHGSLCQKKMYCILLTDVKSKDETVALLKETLGEQENMLQMQEDYINKKEEEINSSKQGITEF